MILNDFECQNTRKRIEGFKRALAMLNVPENELKKTDPLRWQLHVDGVQSLLEDFSEQVQEYETLTNWDENKAIAFEIDDLTDPDLGGILIKARLAAKMSQKELAKRVKIEEKELYRYENKDYQLAPLALVMEVMQVLGIQLKDKVTLEVKQSLKAG